MRGCLKDLLNLNPNVSRGFRLRPQLCNQFTYGDLFQLGDQRAMPVDQSGTSFSMLQEHQARQPVHLCTCRKDLCNSITENVYSRQRLIHLVMGVLVLFIGY